MTSLGCYYRSQVIHLSMERDKLKADASHAMETSRRIVKEGDDIALEIHNRWEAEKRLARVYVQQLLKCVILTERLRKNMRIN